MAKTKVYFTGGGSGGHVFPALAMADALKSKHSENVDIEFIGSYGGIEETTVPKAGYPLHLLRVGKFVGMNPVVKLLTMATLPLAVLKAMIVFFKKRPQIVVGVGGYASVPAVIAAKFFGAKTYLWEPNAQPGMANMVVSKFAKYGLVVFDSAKKKLSTKFFEKVGVPIRPVFDNPPQLTGATTETFKILVFGGSQGARGINRVIAEAVEMGGDWLNGVEIVHQAGKFDIDDLEARYGKLGLNNVQVHKFLFDMENRYQWADLVVSRAGMSTIAELAAIGRASWLVPLPGSMSHQVINAEEMRDAGAAMMSRQENFTAEDFIEKVEQFKKDREPLRMMAENIKKYHTPQATQKIVEFIWNSK